MKKTNLYPLVLEALVELGPEIAAAKSAVYPSYPTLDDVLLELGPLPHEALFLGMAEDGLPVLLNLHDSVPGPLLVIGDEGAGKTALLRTIAETVSRTLNPQNVQFGVLTPSIEEWTGIGAEDSCAGIIPIHENRAMDFVLSLNAWAHANKSKQVVLLLLDGLDKVFQWNPNAIDDLRWLLMRGPARRVWPIVTLNTNRRNQAEPFLQHFRTTIYGRIKEGLNSENNQIPPNINMEAVHGAFQFAMKEGSNWLGFWIPSL